MAPQARICRDPHAHMHGVCRFCRCHENGLSECEGAIAAHMHRSGWQASQASPCMPWDDMVLADGLRFELDPKVGASGVVRIAEGSVGRDATGSDSKPALGATRSSIVK